MIAYQTIRLTEYPDVADIKAEGRNTRTGRLNDHRTIRHLRVKHSVRRSLKRSDRARSMREELQLEAEIERQEMKEFEEWERSLNDVDDYAWEDAMWADILLW